MFQNDYRYPVNIFIFLFFYQHLSIDIKSMDYKSRKHIEELYLITDELINRHDDMNYKYDYKLYKKYKQLKEINKNLQKKIINQHCSGCMCHNQLNENMDESISFIDSKYSTIQENNKTIC